MSDASLTHASDAAHLLARLDRLPATRTIWTLLLLLSLGGAFEFYDLFLMGYIGPGLLRSGYFTPGSVHVLGVSGLATFVSATFAGLFVGTLVFSAAADHLGRRAIFTGSLLWYTVATCVMACQHTTMGILAWRAVTGIGIGVELVTIDAYIAELMPAHIRGRAFAVNQVVQFLAVPFVALVAWQLVPRAPFGVDGWRWVVLAGSVSAALVWTIRRGVPESPRWLVARGRLAEAEAITALLEARVAADLGGTPLSAPAAPAGADARPPTRPSQASASPAAALARLFAPPYTTRTLMLMVFNAAQTIGYYGFASWVPTLLIARGITTTTSLAYAFAIALAAPIGPLLVSRIADDVDRRWQVAASAASIAVIGLVFSQARGAGLIAAGVLLTCANNWMSVAFHAYQSEVFPTPIRAQAVGFVYSWSRFSAIFTSLIIGLLLERAGVTGVFVFIAAAMAVAGGVVALFGPKTSGRALEEIAA